MPSPANNSFLICSSLLRQDGLDSLNVSNLPFPPDGAACGFSDGTGRVWRRWRLRKGKCLPSSLLLSFLFPINREWEWEWEIQNGSTYRSWLFVSGPMGKKKKKKRNGLLCRDWDDMIVLVTQGRLPRGSDFMLHARLDSAASAAVCSTYPRIMQKGDMSKQLLSRLLQPDKDRDLDDGH